MHPWHNWLSNLNFVCYFKLLNYLLLVPLFTSTKKNCSRSQNLYVYMSFNNWTIFTDENKIFMQENASLQWGRFFNSQNSLTSCKLFSGGIIGLGEAEEDRVGLLHTLSTLPTHPESVPINALIAVKGTPLQDQKVNLFKLIDLLNWSKSMSMLC